MLRAGRLDRRINIQSRAAGVDSLGGENGAWSTIGTVWAEFKPIRGTEEFIRLERYAQVEARFTIRYRAGTTAKNRILFDGKTWDIVGVLEIGRREAMDILVKAAANS